MRRPDPSSVEARLRAALNAPLTDIREGVDMSEAAVTRRLSEACEMSSLALELVAVGRTRP